MSAIPRDYPEIVISANAHGFKQDKFKVDFIVGVDYYFSPPRGDRAPRLRMQDYVKQFPAKTINRWSWADYRIPEFTYSGDSGLTAILVAVLLGGHPVIPVGIDFGQGDRRYWWDSGPDPQWRQRANYSDNQQAAREMLIDLCRDAQIRPICGPLLAHWPKWSPDEVLPPVKLPVSAQTAETGCLYSVTGTCFLHPTDQISGVVRLTAREAAPLLAKKKICRLRS